MELIRLVVDHYALDARWETRLDPEERNTSDVALTSLEVDLADIDL